MEDVYVSPVGIIQRQVYQIDADIKYKIQTGFIKYGNEYVPVWRRAKNDSNEQYEEVWYTVYKTVMPREPNSGEYIRSQTVWHDVPGVGSVSLPRLELSISGFLRRHLIQNCEVEEE